MHSIAAGDPTGQLQLIRTFMHRNFATASDHVADL